VSVAEHFRSAYSSGYRHGPVLNNHCNGGAAGGAPLISRVERLLSECLFVRFGSILLKNPDFGADEKIIAP
jgi:hypothetical protein